MNPARPVWQRTRREIQLLRLSDRADQGRVS